MRTNGNRLLCRCLSPALQALVLIGILAIPITAGAQSAHFSYSQILLSQIFNTPAGGVVDAQGNYYVSVAGDSTIKKIPFGCAANDCVKTVGGGFNTPMGLAIDSAGNLFVADRNNNAVKIVPPECSSESCVIPLAGDFALPSGVAVDDNGNVFVADTFHFAVKEIPAGCTDGACVATLGGGFVRPSGLAVDKAGNLFVADFGAGTLSEIPNGCVNQSCVSTIASFPLAVSVAIDNTGNLYVGMPASTNIVELTSSSGYTKQVSLGQGFKDPQSVAVDRNGNVFVADASAGFIWKLSPLAVDFGAVPILGSAPADVTFTFDTAGTVATVVGLEQGAPGLEFQADAGTCKGTHGAGDTCTITAQYTSSFAGPQRGAIVLKDGSGKTIATAYAHAIGNGPQAVMNPGQLSYPVGNFGQSSVYGVAVDGYGNIFFTDYVAGTVNEVPLGCSSSLCVKTIGGGFVHPFGIAVDGAGNVFVTDAWANAVYEILASGGYVDKVSIGSGFADPQSVVVDGNGNIFVGDTGNSAVKEILAAGGYTTTLILGGGFSFPQGVGVDAHGNVWVADSGNNLLKKIPPNCYSASCVGSIASGFNTPIGLAVDSSGDVYVGDFGNNVIKEYVPANQPPLTITIAAFGSMNAFGLAIDPMGNIYVADPIANRVAKLNMNVPPTFNFPTITPVGSTDTTDGWRGVVLKNIGTQPLTLQPITSANLLDAVLTSAGSLDCMQLKDLQVPAGSACQLSFYFAPQGPGPRNGYIQIVDNSRNQGGSMQQVNFTGTGASTAAMITSPTKGSTFPGSSVTFTWTPEIGATNYQVWFGSTPNTSNLGYVGTTDLQATTTNLPTNGSTIYATLYGYANGTWTAQDTATYTAVNITPAKITSPAKGSAFAGSTASFTWTAETGATSYQMWLGTTPGTHDLGYAGTSGLQGSITNIPTLGQTVYATLYGLSGGAWDVQDTATYTEFAFAHITSPAKASTLTATSATFTWTAETGATTYQMWLGSTAGGSDLGVGQSFGLSVTMTGLPADGRTVYATLYGYVNGVRTVQDSATYTAFTGAKAAITVPAKGTTLAGTSATFTWTAEASASSYQLWVGSSPGASDIAVASSFALSTTISGLPADARTLYVTLYGYVSGVRSVQDTATYTAFTGVKAIITSPVKGSTLTSGSVTFTWSAETGASSYQLWAGTRPGASDIGVVQSFGLSATMTTLPTKGQIIYITLYGTASGVRSLQDSATYTAMLK